MPTHLSAHPHKEGLFCALRILYARVRHILRILRVQCTTAVTAGVPGGPIISRVTFEVEGRFGSHKALFLTKRQVESARKRESVSRRNFDAYRRA